MARPPKKGLEFYKKDIGFYEDLKIYDLLESYGPLGVTVYDILLTMVYRDGYYLEAPIENVARNVLRIIGNRWAKKEGIMRVIQFCAESDLFDRDLLEQNVITSAGIQRRYSEITSRNRVDKSRYWLLDDYQPAEVRDDEVSDEETPVSEAKTYVYSSQNQQRIREKNKSKNKIAAETPPPSYDLEKWTRDSIMKRPVYVTREERDRRIAEKEAALKKRIEERGW